MAKRTVRLNPLIQVNKVKHSAMLNKIFKEGIGLNPLIQVNKVKHNHNRI